MFCLSACQTYLPLGPSNTAENIHMLETVALDPGDHGDPGGRGDPRDHLHHAFTKLQRSCTNLSFPDSGIIMIIVAPGL